MTTPPHPSEKSKAEQALEKAQRADQLGFSGQTQAFILVCLAAILEENKGLRQRCDDLSDLTQLRQEANERRLAALESSLKAGEEKRVAEHVCDYRCKGGDGHHAWPSPPPPACPVPARDVVKEIVEKFWNGTEWSFTKDGCLEAVNAAITADRESRVPIPSVEEIAKVMCASMCPGADLESLSYGTREAWQRHATAVRELIVKGRE